MAFPPPKDTDQVFQLSLTELAFTLIFLLLLLSGVMIATLEGERSQTAADREALERAQAARAAGEEASALIRELAGYYGVHPDEILTELRRDVEQAAIRQELQGRLDDLDGKLTELAAMEEQLATAAQENRDLRGQLVWLQEKSAAPGGRDIPPCWADEQTGKVQYLFRIDLQDGGLALAPAWPPERERDALALPGVAALLAGGVQPLPLFKQRMHTLDADCRAKNCRHYVILASQTSRLDLFNQYRYAVEEFFYKYEVR